MIPSELEHVREKVLSSRRPEHLFGNDPLKVKKEYTTLLKTVFPDKYTHNPEAFDIANSTTVFVNQFYEKAKSRIRNGTYGNVQSTGNLNISVKTNTTEYDLIQRVHEGSTYDVYSAKDRNGDDFIVKITCDISFHNRVMKESRVFERIKLEDGQRPFLPEFIECFKTSDEKNGIVFTRSPGFDLFEINEMFPGGVETEHLVWILGRLLEICHHIHSKGVLHGSINPGHLIMDAEQHTISLVDFTNCVRKPKETGDKYRWYSEDYNAPEVKENKVFKPNSDLYSVGKVMVFIAGGNLETLKMPSHVHKNLVLFVHWFMDNSVKHRPASSEESRKYFKQVVDKMFGPVRVFVPFNLPIQ